MNETASSSRTGYLQHKIRPEVKLWIEAEAARLERSQAWVLNKIVEDAFAARQTSQARQKGNQQ